MDFSVINNDNYSELLDYLKSLADEKYRVFHGGLVPGTDNILGVRIPVLRKLAKEISKGDYEGFLNCCTREYYEEDMLRGIVTANIKMDYDELVRRTDAFIPYINNWAVCDIFCSSLKQVKKYLPQFFEHIDVYLKSENQWSRRAGIVLMLSYYLSDEYIERVLSRCEKTAGEEYYVMMARAWLISCTYGKYPKITREYLLHTEIDKVTFNKAIQKCIESYRISKEEKEWLRTLKRK